MAENPEAPPWDFVDPKTGRLTTTAFRWLEGQATTTTTDIGSNLSGIAEVRARAVAAQATAEGASQQAADAGAAAVPFSAYATPANVSATPGNGLRTTGLVTIVPVGGTGPYSFVYSKFSGDTFNVIDPGDDDTTLTTSISPGQDKSAVYQCLVTDFLGATYTAYFGVSASSNS